MGQSEVSGVCPGSLGEAAPTNTNRLEFKLKDDQLRNMVHPCLTCESFAMHDFLHRPTSPVTILFHDEPYLEIHPFGDLLRRNKLTIRRLTTAPHLGSDQLPLPY